MKENSKQVNLNIYLNGGYLNNNPTWHEEDSPWKANKILKLIQQNEMELKSICEIGCGAGEILNQLYTKMDTDIHFTGYEISPHAFEIAKKKEKDRLHFFLEDLIGSSNSQRNFDLTLCIDILEHVENPFDFLKKLKSISKYKIFHIPLDLSVMSVIRKNDLLFKRKKVGHINYFTKELTFALLENCGYTVIDYFYTCGSFDLPRKTIRSKISKFPRKIFYLINKELSVRIFGGFSILILAK